MKSLTLIIAGPTASGKTWLINKVLLPALKAAGGYGYEVCDETDVPSETYKPRGIGG